MLRNSHAVLLGAFATVAALTIGPASSSGQAQVNLASVYAEYQQYVEHEHSWLCGTELDAADRRVALAKGTPVYFQQDPPIITVDYEGTVRLRDLTVVGDISKLTFDPSIFDTNANHPDETWKRKRKGTIGGVKVSIFEPSWKANEFRLFFQGKQTGFDRPDLFLGAIESNVAGRGAVERFSIYARVAPTKLADVTVKTIGNDTAYSSDVINIVVPGYGTTHITEAGNSIDARTIAKKIYENFKDTSQFISIVPRDTHITNQFFAFHRRTRNAVTGIGRTTFNNDAEYGSGGALQGVEWYPNVGLGRADVTSHEMAHQWGHFLDWETIAGITRAGHQPSGHTPLITDGPTVIGSVLEADREVIDTARAFRRAFTIGFPTPPYTYHPLMLYAMGLMPSGQVPDMSVFTNQGQFDPSTSTSPDVGTPVVGGTVDVDIDDIIAVHGKRGGPKIGRKVNRTVVIVSRDEIMSQEEFNYWTWVAQRQRYKKKNNGVMMWTGFGSFNQTINRKARLVNNVDPKAGGKVKGKLKVDYPPYGTTDWKAVRFDNKIPTKIKAGKSINVSGKVIATDRNDFDRVMVGLTKHDPEGGVGRFGVDRAGDHARLAEDIRLFMDVDATGNFSGTINFNKEDKGRWRMRVVLFFPNAGTQFNRTIRSPLHVE